jgi:hypothetical protein
MTDCVWYSPQLDEIIVLDTGKAFLFRNFEDGYFILSFHDGIIPIKWHLIGEL